MPVLSFESLDLVPEGLREHAKPDESDGKIKVNVVAASKIDEFRDNNITVTKERDALLASLGPLQAIVGEDPTAFSADLDELRAIRERVKAGDLKESRQLEEAVGKRTDEMRKSYEEQLQAKGREGAAWKARMEEIDGRYRQSLVVNYIKDAAMDPELGVDPRAIGDITARALSVFRAGDDGKMVPMAGDAPLYGADGVTHMSGKEWVSKLKEQAPYFFKATQGGGAGGGNGNGGGAGEKFKGSRYTKEELAKMGPRERLAALNNEPGARL